MRIEEVLKLVRPNILGLEPYSTARDDCRSGRPEIFLDANENPYNNVSTVIRIHIRKH